MQSLDACYILDGGAFVDTAGWDVTIGQDIQSGGSGIGGLTKRGLGKLSMNGYNGYTGPTIVQAGTLGGTGTLNSPVTVQSTGGLAPGVTGIGTLNIYNTLTLASGSTTTMEISSSGGSLTSDAVNGVTSITYGGTLVVANVGPDPLAEGNSFTLFSASAGSYHGGFSSYVLPALPLGLGWDTTGLTVDGSIKVITRPIPPSFTSVSLLRCNNLVMRGSGGQPNGTYYVLTSTNVALPMSGWTRIATNLFDSSGNFSFTNVISPSASRSFFGIYY